MKKLIGLTLTLLTMTASAQELMTPEKMWQLGRVSALGISKDGKKVVYKVTTPDVKTNGSTSELFTVPVTGGEATRITAVDGLLADSKVSPDGKYIVYDQEVHVENILGKDLYPELSQSNVMVYNGLNYRHWDTWNTGKFNHVFYREKGQDAKDGKDIMAGEPYDSPQKPFGGPEDYIWSADGKQIIYVAKKLAGTEYAISTNTDLYAFELATGKTVNLTPNNPGYDTHPQLSPNGELTWLQMKRDGYEADKNDIIVRFKGIDMNLTAAWDGTVDSYQWSPDGSKIYFIAAVKGTMQLFEVNFPGAKRIAIRVTQLTSGQFDVNSIVGIVGDQVIVSRNDFNTASEIYSYDVKKKQFKQLTQVNTAAYSTIAKSEIQERWVETTDGKKMLVWVVLPPNFNPENQYPALLYCQGGPQSALTNFYSFRWNLHLMASQGYIVVAPNRRGMPGHGVAWNEQISKDWGGQVMSDYLVAIDEVAKEKYVDKARLGAVGASYGGYSVFYLAGIHENRFKTFIAHNGVFNLESMYGTTEEVFFNNWDAGGAYWDSANQAAQITYAKFNPKNNVHKWNTPILIFQGGIDFRVPIGQGQEAFQAAQLQGIKSRLVYFPEENHWVLKPQNALIWQSEFFKWLKETL